MTWRRGSMVACETVRRSSELASALTPRMPPHLDQAGHVGHPRVAAALARATRRLRGAERR
eukprot:450479-Prymnesium_polylepis.1